MTSPQPHEEHEDGLDDKTEFFNRLDQVDEASALQHLTADFRDQDDLERDIATEANIAILDAEDRKDQTRIEKLTATKRKLEAQRESLFAQIERTGPTPHLLRKVQEDIIKIDVKIQEGDREIIAFQSRIKKRQLESDRQTSPKPKSKRSVGESHRQYLIRTGKITPFSTVGADRPTDTAGNLANAVIEAEEDAVEEQMENEEDGPNSHQLLRRPGFEERQADVADIALTSEFSLRPRKRRKVQDAHPSSDEYDPERSAESRAATPASMSGNDGPAAVAPCRRPGHARGHPTQDSENIDLSRIDDGNESQYRKRLADWILRRSRARSRGQNLTSHDLDSDTVNQVDAGAHEWTLPSPDHPDLEVMDGLSIPGDIHPSLFGYQKTGVKWLAELYQQKVGGIIADEMGLGKTGQLVAELRNECVESDPIQVQMIAFLAALHHSKQLSDPVIIVAPATVLQQWVNEFHRWWPPLRVSILHASGSGMLNLGNEVDDIEDRRGLTRKKSLPAQRIIHRVVKSGHVLVTTYTGLQIYSDELLNVHWGYAVLDEGHKIRNPNADITITCKELSTPHRIILSGTPVQNNLSELWSLFDFVYPMRLGTLVNFRNQFEFPIKQGGYANASTLQILTAERCAETLKFTVSQYLLQRLKVDVAADLPEKTEQVLFCKLTTSQRNAYETFLQSDDVGSILAGRRPSLAGIDRLRKICNHPDLLRPELRTQPGYDWANVSNSGKLQVVASLLKIWKHYGHKALLFCQGKLMLNIIERFLSKHMADVSYLRMDGETQIDQRQTLIDRFNTDPAIHLFLLTTRTGGLGINLTGADRIIIYDPDWNPSTDMQARERAWRLGQTKPVSIYRLMTSGTIEEKIYRRQIFKQFQACKVLHDPKQRVAFELSDLYDLFTPPPAEEADRGRLFQGAEVKFGEQSHATANLSNHTPATRTVTEPGRAPPGHSEAESGSVQNLASVAAVEAFHDDPTVNDEKRMIHGIFARSIESAYEHDRIVNGKAKIQPDRSMLQEEARRVAATAASHLRRAEEEARQIPIGTVTWTGEVGDAGRPRNARHGRIGGPSSSSVLMGLTGVRPPSGGEVSGSCSSAAMSTRHQHHRAGEFTAIIAEYIRKQDGHVASKMLVDHFNRLCPTKKLSNDFKAALDKVAVLSKTGGPGRGFWKLRPGF